MNHPSQYALEPDPEGRGYTFRVPALPDCITEGSTREEAITNAKEAIEGLIRRASQRPTKLNPLKSRRSA